MRKTLLLISFVAVCFYASITAIGNTSKCTIQIDFDGLQAIAFGDSTKVSDGILDVAHHTPNIEIKRSENGKESVISNLKTTDLKGKALNISIANKHLSPTRYYSKDISKDPSDFRWCLDIESDIFQKQLYLKEDKFFCKIHFLLGEFFATDLSQDKYQFVTNSTIHSLKRQIATPRAKIELQQTDKLVITGLDKEIDLPYQAGVSYSINITNLPPKSMASMDHFAFYYNVIKADVPQFMPVVVQKAAFFPKPLICSPIIFSKSSIK